MKSVTVLESMITAYVCISIHTPVKSVTLLPYVSLFAIVFQSTHP